MKSGDRVCFNAAVIKRCNHSPEVSTFAGVIDKVVAGGKLAEISVDGGGQRTVPIANLAKITRKHGVVDPTY